MNTISSVGKAKAVIRELDKAIVGKDNVLIKALLAVLAGGHILMEDIPGVGKTTMAVALSQALGLDYNRVQFTPDVLPSDVTGFSIYDKNSGEMRYQKGAILCNLFLADELNRATSRTQSALLQAMEEGEVTVDNRTYPLPQPFVVIATQNPAGAKGTQLLPDSQMDRFMIRLSMGYPAHDDEVEILRRRNMGPGRQELARIVTREELLHIREEVESVYVKDSVLDYIVTLCEKTRKDPRILQGASPRASLALSSLARATAWIQGRDYVLPRDVRYVFHDAIAHRLIWSQDLSDAADQEKVVNELLNAVKAPAIK